MIQNQQILSTRDTPMYLQIGLTFQTPLTEVL